MNKKYFDTRKDSLEDKINTIASEQVAFSKPVTDVKLSVEKKYFESKQGSLEEIASKVVSEGMDPVNKDAVKKKFDDRKDKDIDNDGDTDSSDKFLHKRRKAISKAMKENPAAMALGRTAAAAAGTAVGNKIGDKITSSKKHKEVDEACWDSHKQVGTKMKGGKQVPNCVPKNESKDSEQTYPSKDAKIKGENPADKGKKEQETGVDTRDPKKKTMSGQVATSPEMNPKVDYKY